MYIHIFIETWLNIWVIVYICGQIKSNKYLKYKYNVYKTLDPKLYIFIN